MTKTFVLGDCHGGYKALLQCLERSKFDYKKDTLICLGDVADGWSEVPACFDELLKIKNLVYVLGNHDYWLLDWFQKGKKPLDWTEQGGQATLDAYLDKNVSHATMKKHQKLLEDALCYYVDKKDRVFVHGGFDPNKHPAFETKQNLMWDRDLYDIAQYQYIPDWYKVFVGHTSTYHGGDHVPVQRNNLWNLDQGGGWEGKLSLMNVDTEEFWQSDLVYTLYPEELGRRGTTT